MYLYYAIFAIHIYENMAAEDLTNMLSKNETADWYQNQTSKASSQNAYCSICCMNISARTIGKHCGLHTMCIYPDESVGPNCKGFISIEFTEQEQFALLDAHNTIRNRVASGNEERGDPGPQPQSSNMRMLEWSNELAIIAQRWIKQCVFSHDLCRDLEKYPIGQIIAKGNFATTNDLFFIKSWYDVVDYFDKKHIPMYKGFGGHYKILSQYTQMIWADTYQVGCARAVFQEGSGSNIKFREHFFCNYGPTGNIPGLPIYKIGSPCSSCPEGTGCNVEYPALCGNEVVYEINYEKMKKKISSYCSTNKWNTIFMLLSFCCFFV